MNPYRGKTNLRPFWDYVKTNKQIQIEQATAPQETINYAKKEGELWHVRYQNESTNLKDSKGWKNIVQLLLAPNEAFHCLDLMGAVLQNKNNIPLVDEQSKKSYQAKIVELQSEIEAANSSGDLLRAETLNEEYEQLLDHLSSVLGLGGKTREAGSAVEKARSAVTWRIRSTIKKISQAHPKLAKHLGNSIQTGTYCSYKPERETTWEITA